MARTARASVGGVVYHVLNRGNGTAEVFHSPGDYDAWVDLVGHACDRSAMRVLGYCLMPNHFHMVLWPHGDGDLGRWMQWLMTSHVRRYHKFHGTSGHVWQGRFRAFPAQTDGHLLTVVRYVERNALRANLVEKAEDWRWSSLAWREQIRRPAWLVDGPVPLPEAWPTWVNQAHTEKELAALRRSVNRGTPFGAEDWACRVAAELGLEASLQPRGRPRAKRQ
jgi:putative transposase